jgi:hypothetical protein
MRDMLGQLVALALLRSARAAAVAVAVDGAGVREKTLVVYAYSQHSADAVANARFFLRFGVDGASEDAVFVLVANGCHSLEWPIHDNVIVVERENTCFDFGAWSAGLREARRRGVAFAYAIFLNASVRGPFLPAYEPRPWWRVFTVMLEADAGLGLLGTTVHCADLDARDAKSAHVQSMLLALRAEELAGVGAPFFDLDRFCAPSKGAAIYGGEMALSRAVLDAGLGLGGFLLAHGGRGARIRQPPGDATARVCAELRAATELNLGDVYFPGAHKDVRPLEAVFYKTARSGIYRDDVDRLTHWRYAHAGLDAAEDIVAPELRGAGDCAGAHFPVADARTAGATRDAHRADVETALLAANAAVERARGDVARLEKRLAGAVLV